MNSDRLSSLRCISTGAGAGAGTTGSGGFASIFGRFDELPELAEALRILAISAMVNGAGSCACPSQESWAEPGFLEFLAGYTPKQSSPSRVLCYFLTA